MTVEEMRREMREKVVPEEIVPQNVVNMLIDEDAELPEIDAFMFLTRLRALGMGSADFLNLLEGCGAPDNVVQKIKQNPRMNLQGLILTLDNSELTSDDYTEMLLTARQVWERTLTLRLDKSTEAVKNVASANKKKKPSPVRPDQAEKDYEPDDIADEDKRIREMSFGEVLEIVNSEADEEIEDQEAEEQENAGPEAQEMTFTQAFDKIKTEKKVDADKSEDTSAVSDDSKTLIEIDSEILRRRLSGTDEAEETEDAEETEEAVEEETEADEPDESETEEADEVEEEVRESKEKKIGKNQKSAEKPKEKDDEDDEDDEDGEDEADDAENERGENEKKKHGYQMTAIVGAACGALLLAGAAFAVGKILQSKQEKLLHFADDNKEIFTKIYYASEERYFGGELAAEISDPGVMFGDLLVSGDEEVTLGSYTIGSSLYYVSNQSVSLNSGENGELSEKPDILPPEDSYFTAAMEDGGSLYVLFSGERSGYVKINENGEEHTVSQDGLLTEYEVTDSEIKLGTVYTPVFEHDVRLEDDDMYLPHAGGGVIASDKIIISDTKGCSYGVSASYSKSSGALGSACAVIGDPVAAGADGRFAVTGDYGLLIKTDGDDIEYKKTGKLLRGAFFSGGCAVCVKAEKDNEINGDIQLYSNELKLSSIVRGYSMPPEKLWFGGSTLNTLDGDRLIKTDCGDISAPTLVNFEQITGAVIDDSAITFRSTDEGIVLTRYELTAGAPAPLCEYEKELTPAGASSVRFGAARAAVVDGTASGAAYSWYDGGSVVSEYVVFEPDKRALTVTEYDDETGFTAAFSDNGRIKAICADGVKVPSF